MKTATELGISQQEYDALLWVRERLVEGDINGHVCKFDMCSWGKYYYDEDCNKCGTAACIGGWMYVKMQNIQPNEKGVYIYDICGSKEYVQAHVGTSRDLTEKRADTPLTSLFWRYGTSGERITPADGIKAIDEFLSGNTQDPWAICVGQLEEQEG